MSSKAPLARVAALLDRAGVEYAVIGAHGVNAWPELATPDDLIILKLIADRPKDRQDLLGLMALPDLDWDHVERWASEWGVTDRLSALRREANR